LEDLLRIINTKLKKTIYRFISPEKISNKSRIVFSIPGDVRMLIKQKEGGKCYKCNETHSKEGWRRHQEEVVGLLTFNFAKEYCRIS